MCVLVVCVSSFVFFFFKQKTAYEMRISDWSSDVCSSDLRIFGPWQQADTASSHCFQQRGGNGPWFGSIIRPAAQSHRADPAFAPGRDSARGWKIGRASCRERVCQYV